MAQGSAPAASPPGRALRTLFSVIWEREGLWLVRWRMSAFLPLFLLTTVSATAVAPVVLFIPLLAWDLLVPLCVLVIWALAREFRPLAAVRFDFRGEMVVGPEEAIRFEDLTAVVLDTHLAVRWMKYGPTAKQLWGVRVDGGARARMQVAIHTDEYTMYSVARRLASQLRLPLIDACDLEGGVVPEALRSDPGTQPAVSVERDASGVHFTWRPRLGLVPAMTWILLLILGASLGLQVHPELAPHRLGLWVASGETAAFLIFAAFIGARRATGGLSVSSDRVIAWARFPFPHRRVFRRDRIERVRVSQLLAAAPPSKPCGPEVLSFTCVDLVGARGLLLRVRLARREARYLGDQLRVALGLAPKCGADSRSGSDLHTGGMKSARR